MCFALRSHMSAAPPQGGLTPALGGKKHSAVALSALQLLGFGQHCSSDGSCARFFFGQVHLTRSHIACVAFVDFGNCDWLAVGLSAPDAVASVTAGGEFAGRARALGLRFRQVRHGITLAGFLPA